MESDWIALCGAKGVPDAQRHAVRGGSTAGQVVLGGQRIAVRRPRARPLTEGELSLPGFERASSGDPLDFPGRSGPGRQCRRMGIRNEPETSRRRARYAGTAGFSAWSRRRTARPMSSNSTPRRVSIFISRETMICGSA
jgi:hypothetical protein